MNTVALHPIRRSPSSASAAPATSPSLAELSATANLLHLKSSSQTFIKPYPNHSQPPPHPYSQNQHHKQQEQQQQQRQLQKTLSSTSLTSLAAATTNANNSSTLQHSHFPPIKNRSSLFFNTSTTSLSQYPKFGSSSRDFLYHSNSASRLAFSTSYDGFFSDDVYAGGSDDVLITAGVSGGSGGSAGASGGAGTGIMEFEDSRYYEGRYEDRDHEYEDDGFYRHQINHSNQHNHQQQKQQPQAQARSNSHHHLPGSHSRENLFRQRQLRLSEEPAPSEPTIFAGNPTRSYERQQPQARDQIMPMEVSCSSVPATRQRAQEKENDEEEEDEDEEDEKNIYNNDNVNGEPILQPQPQHQHSHHHHQHQQQQQRQPHEMQQRSPKLKSSASSSSSSSSFTLSSRSSLMLLPLRGHESQSFFQRDFCMGQESEEAGQEGKGCSEEEDEDENEYGPLYESKEPQQHQNQQKQKQQQHQQTQEEKGVKESGGTEHLSKSKKMLKRKSLQLELHLHSSDKSSVLDHDLDSDDFGYGYHHHYQTGSPMAPNQDHGQDEVIPDQEKPMHNKRRKKGSSSDTRLAVVDPAKKGPVHMQGEHQQRQSGGATTADEATDFQGESQQQQYYRMHHYQHQQHLGPYGSDTLSPQTTTHPLSMHRPTPSSQSHFIDLCGHATQQDIEQTYAHPPQHQNQSHARRHDPGDDLDPSSSSTLSTSSSSAFASSHSSNFITEDQFLLLAEDYLLSLSPKKREKALLSNSMYQKILMVLIQPKNTQVSTAQFRFWAKKMFTLSTTPTHHVVCHGGKPVATKECLYDVLVYCHRKSSHGGRDKTSAEVRQHYSWVPKELIARFVKHCPLCLSRRTTQPRSSGLNDRPDSSASYYSGYPRGHVKDEEADDQYDQHDQEQVEDEDCDAQSVQTPFNGDTPAEQQYQQRQSPWSHPQCPQDQYPLPLTRPGYDAPFSQQWDHHQQQQQQQQQQQNQQHQTSQFQRQLNHRHQINRQMQSPVHSISDNEEERQQDMVDSHDFKGEDQSCLNSLVRGAFLGDERPLPGCRALMYPQNGHALHQHSHGLIQKQQQQQQQYEPASPSTPIAVVHPNGHILHDRHPILNSARLLGLDQGVATSNATSAATAAAGARGGMVLSAFPMTPSPSFHHRQALSLSPLHLNTAALRARLLPQLHPVSGLADAASLNSPIDMDTEQAEGILSEDRCQDL